MRRLVAPEEGIEEEVGLDVGHAREASGVSAGMEVGYHLAGVGSQVQEGLERRVFHHLARQLRPVYARARARASVCMCVCARASVGVRAREREKL